MYRNTLFLSHSPVCPAPSASHTPLDSPTPIVSYVSLAIYVKCVRVKRKFQF